MIEEIAIEQVTKDEWGMLSTDAHKSVFGKILPREQERIDHALLAVLKPKNLLLGYVTCREIDAETVYWQFGGSFHDVRGSIHIFKAYKLMLEHSGKTYKRMTTLIENTNKAMLKMAAAAGLVIIGVRNYGGSVLLEHVMEYTK